MRALAAAALLLSACEGYVAPPRIASVTGEAGVYDPMSGPLQLKLSKAVDLATLGLDMYVDRRGTEGELCLGDPLPAGCGEAATSMLGPCTPKSQASMRLEDGRLQFTCAAGGAIVVDDARETIELQLEGKLIPFERYTIALSPGLASADGADTGVALEARFSVKSDIMRGPTDFEQGMFFAIVDIFEPIPAQFQFWFWFSVNAETGQLFIYAADADPRDPVATDAKVNRNPAEWVADPVSDKGATLSAIGQVAEVDGQRLMRIFPFHLKVIVPPVEALATEVSARLTRGEYPAAPPMEREIITGTMSSPGVYLGLDSERAALGPGRGAISMFRLTAEEQPPLASILGHDMTEERLLHPDFGD